MEDYLWNYHVTFANNNSSGIQFLWFSEIMKADFAWKVAKSSDTHLTKVGWYRSFAIFQRFQNKIPTFLCVVFVEIKPFKNFHIVYLKTRWTTKTCVKIGICETKFPDHYAHNTLDIAKRNFQRTSVHLVN